MYRFKHQLEDTVCSLLIVTEAIGALTDGCRPKEAASPEMKQKRMHTNRAKWNEIRVPTTLIFYNLPICLDIPSYSRYLIW